MNCMKCGKETEQDQIFCPECLAEMEKYPVKPGTVVQIPVQPAKKQPHHRRPVVTPEEQVRRLAKRNHRMTLALILVSAVAILFALLSFDILEKSSMHRLLGQNYSVIQQTEAPAETVAPSPLH
ncbi:MAG: hypothetical protein IJ375_01625 [Oscillospiraceae bacterium]|nr:hypothetical protein [Oscillospiraceae bacterium]